MLSYYRLFVPAGSVRLRVESVEKADLFASGYIATAHT